MFEEKGLWLNNMLVMIYIGGMFWLKTEPLDEISVGMLLAMNESLIII